MRSWTPPNGKQDDPVTFEVLSKQADSVNESIDRVLDERNRLRKAMREIANSNPNDFEDPAEHANWCIEQAREAQQQ